jgi:hypothetical protein
VLEYDLIKCLEEYYNYTGAKWMNLYLKIMVGKV